MIALDRVLEGLESRVNALSREGQVALFAACCRALLPEFQSWSAHRGEATGPLLDAALQAAEEFAVSGREPSQAQQLLQALEEDTPPGESPDMVPSTFAQDCWICADVCIRVIVDSSYNAGSAIEYALEPMMTMATEHLFGVSQIGSGEREEAQCALIMSHPPVVAAIDFCRWATDYLSRAPRPIADDLALVRSRAIVLDPRGASG